MFRNYIKIAVRSLFKNKTYTFINVVGLSVGIAAVLLLYHMVSYELSFNKDFPNYDRIVRVLLEDLEETSGFYSPGMPIPVMGLLASDISQFEQTARIRETWNNLIIPNPNGGNPLKKFDPQNGETTLFTESSFLEIFDFPLLIGDAKSSLSEPNTIVLTKTMAEKCFGEWENAMGKTLLVDNIYPIRVTGVLEDLPSNCDFSFPYLMSYNTLEGKEDYFYYDNDWGSTSSNDQFYALLSSAEQFDAADANVNEIARKEYTDNEGRHRRRHVLQALALQHFDERVGHLGSHQVTHSRLRILIFIGLLIMVMACFNFINLATAQATLRTKEVGVRKTLGSGRGQLVSQFMTETALTVLVSLILGVGLAILGTPLLQSISSVPEGIGFLVQPTLWGFLALVAIAITLLAGLYPSLSLASFRPIEALKDKVSSRHFAGAKIRKSLVVVQFIIAQALMIGIIITLLQLDFIRSKDLGFRQDLVCNFSINTDEETIARHNTLKQKLLQIPNVEHVSFSSDQPLSNNTSMTNFRYASRPKDEEFSLPNKFADTDYQDTYGIELLEGKWLTPSDTLREALVNETLAEKLGVDNVAEMIGQKLTLGARTDLKIVGVMKDFHTHDLKREKLPLMISTLKRYYRSASVRIRPENTSATVASIKSVFDEVLPEQIYNGTFVEDDIAGLYEEDDQLAATCWIFGLLAIFISCLGLFGLATHAATQRTKEIGVRKVLGASVGNLVGLLSKDFIRLVLLALLLAIPIAWYLMHQWLQDFAYRIDIQWWVFALAGLAAIVVAFLTVSFQSIKAALANPVESLRSE